MFGRIPQKPSLAFSGQTSTASPIPSAPKTDSSKPGNQPATYKVSAITPEVLAYENSIFMPRTQGNPDVLAKIAYTPENSKEKVIVYYPVIYTETDSDNVMMSGLLRRQLRYSLGDEPNLHLVKKENKAIPIVDIDIEIKNLFPSTAQRLNLNPKELATYFKNYFSNAAGQGRSKTEACSPWEP